MVAWPFLGTGAAWLAPSPAHACGGTFCDAGPQAMPVDQTGENILFVMAADGVEAHIQIQYDPTTEADKFAWVIPVTVLPEFSVGSNALFNNVLGATVPTYGFSTTQTCGGPLPPGGGGGTSGDDGSGFVAEPDAGSGPDVVYEATVGAFDVVVLQGGTTQEVMDWLAANGYQQDMAAAPILDEYLNEDYLFAAFKLTQGAGVSEIHPVALKFPSSDEACIPIRLTRIAAQDHMDIRSFFLSDARVVPRNYRHVLVNLVKLDWPQLAANYKELVTLAADQPMADGHAFVTEYAGPSSIVSDAGIFSPAWDAAPFVGMDPKLVVDELQTQGLVFCSPGACQYSHTLIEGLLATYLPVPDGIEPGEFYGCLSCYEGLIDGSAWDAAAFSTAIQDRIIDPGSHATDLLRAWPYLTRMYTTISPEEMTADPFFYQNPDLPPVDFTNGIAQRTVLCNGEVWTLPDGRQVFLPLNGTWPDFPDEMPWVEEIEQMPPAGAPMSLVDNSALIDDELAKWNCRFDWPNPAACGGGSTDGATDSGPGTGGGSSGGGNQDPARSSCACRVDRTAGAGVPLLLWLGFGVRRRR